MVACRVPWRVVVIALWLTSSPAVALAGERFALVMSGASGGDEYARKYDGWRSSLVDLLERRLSYPTDHAFVLAEHEQTDVLKANRDNVRRVLDDLRMRMAKDDQLLVVLLGHGTLTDSGDAKFNLVGPDLTASEWTGLMKPIAGKIVFVDTTGGSFPFLHKLAAPGRIVVTATDSAAQQFETVFPEYFVKAFEDSAADADKDGRTSIWEAFGYASAGVRDWFEKRGQLPTERPMLDETGDGVGREAQSPGSGGAVARLTYLGPDSENGDRDLLALRASLQQQLEALASNKSAMPAERYQRELERLLLEIARVSREIRAKS